MSMTLFASSWERAAMPVDRLGELLRELAQVESADPGHDMGAVFDAANASRQRSGQPAMRLDDFLMVVHVLRVALCGEPSTAQTASDVLFLNQYLRFSGAARTGVPATGETALSELLADVGAGIGVSVPQHGAKSGAAAQEGAE